MMSDETAYYRQRAVTERALARATENSDVAAIHEELARQYQALVDQVDLRPAKGADLSPAPEKLKQARWHPDWGGSSDVQAVAVDHRQ